MATLAVLGVGTGVGKTHVAQLILRAFGPSHHVAPFKPIESGVDLSDGVPLDAALLLEASGQELSLMSVCPWPLPRPVAPAAEIDRLGIDLSLGDVLAAADRLREDRPHLLFEGAGGVLSPLTWSFDALDVAAQLHASVLLVANDVLGAMSAVRTAVESVERRSLRCAGIVLNRWDHEASVDPDANRAALTRYVSLPIWSASSSALEPALVDALCAFFEPGV